MKIKIKETGKIESLKIISEETGIEWTNDFIGNYGALTDGQFTWNNEEDIYETDQVTYDWWFDIIERYTEADAIMTEFLAGIEDPDDSDNARRAIEDACNCDLEYIPDAIISTINDLRESM